VKRRVLAADIGGTKIRLTVFSREEGGLHIEWERMLASDPEQPPEKLIAAAIPAPLRRGLPAVFAVAGPVSGAKVKLTNLPWELDAEHLTAFLELEELLLINDVEAMAGSIPAMHGLPELKPGRADPCGHRAVLSLGTGLGEGGAVFAQGKHHPWAGEGGHGDWAPTTELEWELSRFLVSESGLAHLSRERLLSGRGLFDLARFFAWKNGNREIALPEGEDPAAAVHRAARERSDLACQQALELFVRLLGAEAGNLALVTGATGGVFLGGGMAVKLHQSLRSEIFRESFLAKGRMRALLLNIPVMLLPDERAPLLGAAIHAFSLPAAV